MRRPRKAIVLCAGLGTRMRPLSLATPKPLMPLWRRPILEHLLDMLASWGVRDVLINVHHAADRLVSYLRTRPPRRLRIEISFEPEILGTGGAVRRADWFLDDEPTWMVNSDIAARRLSPAPLLRAFSADSDTIAALWIHDRLGPRTVAVQEGYVTDFACPDPGAPGTMTFCGLQLVSPRVRDFFPPAPSFSIVDVYRRCMASGLRVAGVCIKNAFWQDVGSPDRYIEAHRRAWNLSRCTAASGFPPDRQQRRELRSLRASGVHIEGAVSLGRDVRVEPGARLKDCVVWDGARIGPRASVADAIVADGTRVNHRLHGGIALRAPAADEGRLAPALDRLGWPIADTMVEPLPARGSGRDLLRIRWGRRHAIVIRYSLEREENALYAAHARALSKLGIRVPRVLLDMPDAKVVVMEDVGDRHLQNYVTDRDPEFVHRVYVRVLREVVRWHQRGTEYVRQSRPTLCKPFSDGVYRYERDLFAEYVLPRYSVPPRKASAILSELAGVAEHLKSEPRVLIHRDLQSSNILVYRGAPVFIDFQGMRLGPASYDLASLLCDPYVSLDAPLREALLYAYVEMTGGDPAAWRERMRWGAVERLIQALGAYGRLGTHRSTRSFLRFIPPAWAMMESMLTGFEGLPTLREMVYDALRVKENGYALDSDPAGAGCSMRLRQGGRDGHRRRDGKASRRHRT